MSEEKKGLTIEDMKSALTRAPTSDLFKMLTVTTVRMLAAQHNESVSEEHRGDLEAELKIVSDEVDKRFPLVEPSLVYKA